MTLVASNKQGPHGLLLVVTDKEILGMKFEEGKVQLDLTKNFYQGEEKKKEEIKSKIHDARDLHFTGKEAVAILIEMELVEEKKVLWVEGIPHAEVILA
jgi:uncharacterized protein